jgi:hypothetical protein
MDGDSEVSYPDGHYEVLYCEGWKARYRMLVRMQRTR